MASGLRIGELAELGGATPRAIRHYETLGLLPAPARDGSGYRRYGAEHLVRLVRIRRLRSLGMPLEQIGASLEADAPGDPQAALRALADELSEQIARLSELRDRALALAAAGGLPDPVEALARELRRHGLLRGALPPEEVPAVRVLDAIHPGGIEGVAADAAGLLADPSRIAPLLARVRALPADADDATVDALAAELAAVVPIPENPPPPIAPEAVELLFGSLSPASRRLARRLRARLEERRP
jgi:DNA-binding transcriptional MerR regulator